MLNTILKWSIAQRWLVVISSIIISIWAVQTIKQMPLDVFPSFAPPQVEIQTEAPGLAPEEVEALITLRIESAINGTPGVTTVRSASAVGLSSVKVVFDWGTDIYKARQLVTERVQQAAGSLPNGIAPPEITPISSPLGATISYAFTAQTTPLMEVRRIIDWQVTNRLLAVPGVSQVFVLGGDIREYQVLVDPAKLKAFDVSLQQVSQASAGANVNAPGGFLIKSNQEILIRGVGRIESIEQLKKSVITQRNGTPVLLENVADVQIGAAFKRGDASFNGQKAVIVLVNKQPLADTPTVTRKIEAAIEEIKPSLPKDVKFAVTFRQEDFIESSVKNVEESLRDGGIIVGVILILFLMNWRTIIISLSALPLSLLMGLLFLDWLGEGINTMTLGGLAVAIGSAVDDAIVDVENVYRCLRENRLAGDPVPQMKIILEASNEVRASVLFSSIIIAVVFAPIFTLTGVEGRIFTPMGLAYLLTVFASTVVAFTVTPALCALLLVNCPLPPEEPFVARLSKRLYQPILQFSIRRPQIVLVAAIASLVTSLIVFPSLGRIFLPEFQERSLIIAANLVPGVSLDTTTQAGLAIQDALKGDKRLDSVQVRAGMTPGDSDILSVDFAHIDVEISPEGMKEREKTLEWLREEFAKLPGVAANVGGFISHRMDEVLSGVRSAIAVKIFGPDLDELRTLASQIQTTISSVAGVVDLQTEPQVPIKQLQIKFDREAAARYGLSVGEISETIETALNGRVVSQVLEKQQVFDLLVWLKASDRADIDTISNLLIDTPSKQKIPLAQVAKIEYGSGPNTINRENVSRRIIVSANATGRDLKSVITDIRAKIKQQVQIPSGYFIEYGGQFESEERASQNLTLFSTLALVVIAVLMYFAVKSIPSMLMIMVNLPLALVGGIFSIALVGGVVSVASLVGFITLFGVAVRNGLLLVENYNSKIATGMPLHEVLVLGSQERLGAILMTALTSALGMAPLVIGIGPGKEILQPLAVVVLGGLFTSTALTLIVLPALYSLFSRFVIPKNISNAMPKNVVETRV
ncbi:efflux RND transporter permease subunit [aff. Roholtiella sp. LEGE 12411]|uniref:efflux RND transporter permease subunit n=1 Tax=aff. Roholtiella sp. LEGE 12411 TaxID=1828822 RepID=UPI001881DD67|nr:efflux RND transporter permease subunit [aff. Roholtiella sp. LEGE 12411]MBE9034904.1 efflux RND transporter permease subunit [aff. Roholtiella sp. LEGE 12411]